MSSENPGQYDTEYSKCRCFWGTAPGKYVQHLADIVSHGKVLDLGAGEGKNAIYLAKKGFQVTAVDCSVPGLANFKHRLEDLNSNVQELIRIENADIRSYLSVEHYDVVIAYGLLHCLSSIKEVEEVVRKMKSWTKDGGFNIIVAFTPKLPVPEVQKYLRPTLIEAGILTALYSDWRTLKCEEEVISEIHPTSKDLHHHSVIRLMTQKVVN